MSSFVTMYDIMSELELSDMLFDCPFAFRCGNSCYCTQSDEEPKQKDHNDMISIIRNCKTMKHGPELVARHISKIATQLCLSGSGNYVVQEAFDIFTETTLGKFLADLDVGSIMKDQYGCRVIQKLTELEHFDTCGKIARQIKEELVDLCTHFRANFAIQSLCANMSIDDLCEIINIITPHATGLCMHEHGAYVLQVILKAAATDLNHVRRNSEFKTMMQELTRIGIPLLLDKHGNYTAQDMVACLSRKNMQGLLTNICDNFVTCVASPSGSRVVEKLLTSDSRISRDWIVDAMLGLDGGQTRGFQACSSSFFVFQKAVQCSTSTKRKKLKRKFSKNGSLRMRGRYL